MYIINKPIETNIIIKFTLKHLPAVIGWYSSCGNRKHVNTCSPVRSSVSGWNVNNGWAWFSDSQTAFSCRFTSEYGRLCSWLPDTSSTWSAEQLPNSAGSLRNLLSRRLSTPSDVQSPISSGRHSRVLRSAFRLLSFVILPMDGGKCIRKFSVRMSSCMFWHLKLAKRK